MTWQILARIVADIHEQQPDHIACTGDVAHIGLPDEFRTAESPFSTRWVRERRSASCRATMMPMPAPPLKPMAGLLAPWCAAWRRPARLSLVSQPRAARPHRCQQRRADPAADGNRPRVGSEQIARTEALLERARDEGLIRVVLIHHPPYVGGARRGRELSDAAAFEAMLKRKGADLVLHGHNHSFSLAWRPGPGHDVPIVGVPSHRLGPRGRW